MYKTCTPLILDLFIYVASNDEVNDGDYFIHPDGFIIKANVNSDHKVYNCKKVIGTTDPSLIDVLSISYEDTLHITELKEGEIVRVEYKEIVTGNCDCPCHDPGVTMMHIIACCFPTVTIVPDVNKDGCLDIITKQTYGIPENIKELLKPHIDIINKLISEEMRKDEDASPVKITGAYLEANVEGLTRESTGAIAYVFNPYETVRTPSEE